MVSSRKRGRQEMEAEVVEPPSELSMIDKIRNMWEFANLAQWIFIFGRAVKIDENLDIEDLEMECMKTQSFVLADIGLALLKLVSSHRGLTPEIFDEYTRRQFVHKAPQRNPFGVGVEPAKFAEFDVFTKIRVLQQLTQWIMCSPDRIRERMDEQKDGDQTYWRIEPFGWDSEDRTYIVLDDNRLYRLTNPPPPPPPPKVPKKGSKKARAALRASKRRMVSEPEASDNEAEITEVEIKEAVPEDVAETVPETVPGAVPEADPEAVPEAIPEAVPEYDGLGGMKWECIAITLDEFNTFIASIEKSRDANEKELKKRIQDDVLPLLEKQDEARKRKALQKERELFNLERLATAKRSSRIAGKLEQQRHEDEIREAERKRQIELAMAKKEQEKWMKLEKERESRMMTREQRLKEREARRILHEEELAALSEDSKKIESGEGRLSERHLKAEMEKKKQALEELAEEDDWVFDCICGAYGQVDDGTLSIACEKCNVWQHTKCVGISDENAGREDFRFICKSCIRSAERAAQKAVEKAAQKAAEKAAQKAAEKTGEKGEQVKRPTITIKLGRPSSSSSAATPAPIPPPPNGVVAQNSERVVYGSQPLLMSPKKQSPIQFLPSRPTYDSPYSNGRPFPQPSYPPQAYGSNGNSPMPPKIEEKSPSQGSATPGNWTPYANGYSSSRPAYVNGQSPFSSPHPNSPTSLPPPYQSPPYLMGKGLPPMNSATPGQSTASSPAPSFSYRKPSFPETPGGSHTLYQSPLIPNGQYKQYYDQPQRQSSIPLPSPLANAPVLSPSNIPTNTPAFNSTNRNLSTNNPSQSTIPFAPFHASPSPQPPSQTPAHIHPSGPAHGVALPPVSAGISPMKHSPPPRPLVENSPVFSTPAPSVLRPVAPLVPSPPLPNLTPPVKPSDQERRWNTEGHVAGP